MAKLFIRLTFSLLFYTVFNAAFAQGSWQPTGANNTFPRTLFKASEIPAVRQSLADPERAFLYTGVYWGGYNPAPTDNTSTENRRLRARAAKNAAFARIMNLKPAANGGFEPLTATEITQLDNNVLLLLNNINTQVSSLFTYEQWQWRSKELIDYLVAYDLMRGAGVPVTTLEPGRLKLQEFAGNLYSSGSGFVGSIYNNHLFMTGAALGMAGVVLNDMGSGTASRQPQNWINVSMYNMDNAMWRASQRQSEPGKLAGYAEGPYYFKYAMLNCLPFFRAFGNFLPDGTYSFTWNSTTRQIRNPYFDPNYDLLYQWMTDITMPDGRFPALEDSYVDMGMPELAITGKPQFVKAFNGQNMEASQLNTFLEQLDGPVDMRANYLAANVTPAATEKPLTAMPYAGNLIFRSGDGFNGNYLHVYGKNGIMLTNSGGHNQGDAGSFSLYAKGQLLALDAGYLKSDRRTELGNAYNHNLVLVDGAGPIIGSAGTANDAQAYIQNTFKTPGLQYGEMQTSYGGASITRKTISIRGEYYLMADFINAASAHSYTWQLHGFGLENGTPVQGVFTADMANHEGTWLKNGVSLKAHVTATNGATTYTKALGTHETTYNMPESHTTFLVKKDNVSQTQFLAALTPYTANPAATTTLTLNNMAGLVTATTTFTDLVFSKADTILQTVNTATLPQTVSSDANLTFYSVNNNQELNQAFLQNGTLLKYGTEELIKSNRRANLVWQQLSSGQFHGYVSKAATLLVKVAARPETVSGDNLSSWTYNPLTGILTVTFSQPSEFEYKIVQAPLPVELVAFSAKKVNRQVQLNWQTASEKNNEAFDLQISADGKNWKTFATKTGQGTTSELTSYEHLHTPEFSGQIYYRLAQRDLDGTTTYSAVKTLWFESEKVTRLTVYPNPAADMFWLETESNLTEKAELVFYNTAGVVVYKQQVGLQAGANSVKIALPASLAAGLYQAQLLTSDQLRNFKLQKSQ